MNMHLIALRCVDECERQQVGLEELGRLIQAYDWALMYADNEFPTIRAMRHIAQVIDPRNAPNYRRTPVTFANGGGSVHHTLIMSALESMWEALDEFTPPKAFIKQFLYIHPFQDGNGRTAFVLYNWLNKTMHTPVPLPDFFGEM